VTIVLLSGDSAITSDSKATARLPEQLQNDCAATVAAFAKQCLSDYATIVT
jgi:hypothetical protein